MNPSTAPTPKNITCVHPDVPDNDLDKTHKGIYLKLIQISFIITLDTCVSIIGDDINDVDEAAKLMRLKFIMLKI